MSNKHKKSNSNFKQIYSIWDKLKKNFKPNKLDYKKPDSRHCYTELLHQNLFVLYIILVFAHIIFSLIKNFENNNQIENSFFYLICLVLL